MVKISITLPNSAQITFESEESEIIHEVVGMVLRDLPKDLMQSPPTSGGTSQARAVEKGTSVDHSLAGTPDTPNSETRVARGTPNRTRRSGSSPSTSVSSASVSSASVSSASVSTRPSTPADSDRSQRGAQSNVPGDAFVEFCRSANPLGDMRRVVVAAEGARRFLDMDSVDTHDLARLFDLAGWRRPHNFTQTLRNAARDKFRWLERVPGRAGRYAASDRGRTITLGE